MSARRSRRRHQTQANHSASRVSAVPRPTIRSQARWMVLTADREGRSSGGTESRPWTTVLVPVLGSLRHEASPGIFRPPLTVPSSFRCPRRISGLSGAGGGVELQRGELDRLVVVDRARGGVADHHLDRDGDRRDREREQEAQPVVAVAPAAQHPHRIGRGDEEPGRDQGGEVHVRELVLDGVVEDHRPDVDVGDGPGRVHREAPGLVHPRVGRHHHQGAQQADDGDGHAASRSAPTGSGASSRRCRSR